MMPVRLTDRSDRLHTPATHEGLCSTMAWATPLYSRSRVDAAGRAYMRGLDLLETENDFDGYLEALNIINNWRSSHSFPLNTFQSTLRKKGRRVDPDCLVAQRIKRLSSVHLKLERYPGLRLSQIQDIGGCRIVMRDVNAVRELVATYRRSDIKHSLAQADDYLQQPQPSGYRGFHLVYKYFSDKSTDYNNLKIEVQVRSKYQHAWATAVETVGTFLKQSLKSSVGESAWLRFFAIMGSVIAFEEGTPPVAGTPAERGGLIAELRSLATELDVVGRLEIYGSAIQLVETNQEGQFYLLELDPAKSVVKVQSYGRGELAQAQQDYLEVERRIVDTGVDAVLVSVDSMASLQRAYPNYFLDTRIFIGIVRDALRGAPLVIIDEPNAIKANVQGPPSSPAR